MAAPDQQQKANRPRNRAQAGAPQPDGRLPGRQRIGWALVLAAAVAALALDRLFTLTGEERYQEKAGQTLAAFAGSAPRLGTFAATYARAVAYHLENSSAQR